MNWECVLVLEVCVGTRRVWMGWECGGCTGSVCRDSESVEELGVCGETGSVWMDWEYVEGL